MSIQERVLAMFWDVLEGNDYEVEQIKKDLDASDDLVKRFSIDSLDMVEFYVRIQDEFGVKIPQDDYLKLNSIADIDAYLSNSVLPVSEQAAGS